ncbi:MAG: FprA family A-type flavoprotein, partial [Methanocorpusculum sp.]|nr:FprA family A-type flavoprotein [Methanocorpusculum sp.]
NTAYLVRALRPKVKYLGVIGSYGWGTNAVNYLAEMLAPLGAEMLEPVYIKGLPDEQTIANLHKLADSIEERHKTL